MRGLAWAAWVATAAMLCGCGADVGKMIASPQKFDGKEVKLEGIVKDIRSVPETKTFPGATLYQLQSGGGTIWVLRGRDSAQKILPFKNSRIALRGAFRAEMKIQNDTYQPLVVEYDAKQDAAPAAPGRLNL